MALNTIPNKGLTSRGYPSDRLVTPIIINGDMSVAQRATSSTGITGDGYFTVDRFKNEMSSAGTWTQSQSTDVPSGQGFSSSVKYDCTTANASLSAGTYGFITQRFEGQNLQMLKFGTSSAETLTLSFWVKSNKTGTYIAEIITFATTKSQSQSYTISSADTWEKKTLTFTGDTATAIANSNARSLNLIFWLVAGTNNTSGTLNTSFNTTVQANRAVGQVNLADSTDNEWYITGVQLEVGEFDSTTIPSFPFESYASNYQRCLRYLYQITSNTSTDTDIMTVTGNGSAFFGAFRMPVKMRTAVSVSKSADGDFYIFGGSTGSISSLRGDRQNEYSTGIVSDTSTTGGTSIQLRLNSGTGKYLRFDAEL
jgi:hypothetical protein